MRGEPLWALLIAMAVAAVAPMISRVLPGLLLVVRGVPAMLVYRRTLPLRQRVQLMFLTATALPLLVALAEIGVDAGSMLPENAAALVGAGVLSVAVFPLLATRLQTPADAVAPTPTR